MQWPSTQWLSWLSEHGRVGQVHQAAALEFGTRHAFNLAQLLRSWAPLLIQSAGDDSADIRGQLEEYALRLDGVGDSRRMLDDEDDFNIIFQALFAASRLKDRASLLVVFNFASDAMLPRKVADEGKAIALANRRKAAADRLSVNIGSQARNAVQYAYAEGIVP